MDVVRQEAQEAIVKGTERWIRAAFASLDLEEPDGDIDRKAERSVVGGVMIGGEFDERDALTWAELFEDTVLMSVMYTDVIQRVFSYPEIPMAVQEPQGVLFKVVLYTC